VLLGGAAMSLLLGCGKNSFYEVGGVEGGFCVPHEEYIAPGVFFVPEDEPDVPEGFSTGGCHRLEEGDRPSCQFPSAFISADVDPLSKRIGQTWGELRDAALYSAVANAPHVRMEADQGSGYLVVSSPEVSPYWFVWQRAKGAGTASSSLDLNDRLVATCAGTQDFAGNDGVWDKGGFACERYVAGEQYAIHYQFASKDRVPSGAEMASIEKGIFSTLDSWRCKKEL
jgi:hypothetical protein